ncbi:MAG: ACP S-malonyltransferase [Deltaproteobacteria bacterium]|nr:ACP S-malonyltransferase [Deltaproteobacteria bacterium]
MLAVLFPGQGAQEVGMGQDVYSSSAAGRAVFDAADEALGFSLSKLIFEGPAEELVRTEIGQPAILTASIALYRALQEKIEVAPAFVAGHSLGEYSALVATGSLPLEAAVKLVNLRGRFMQEAVPQGEGAMAAILGTSVENVVKACEEAAAATGQVVLPTIYIPPIQTVIAGATAAVEQACEKAKELGARKTVPLAVSAPFHCALMQPAADKFALELASCDFADPSPPVVSNVESTPNNQGSRVSELLERQIVAPVCFTDMVNRLAEDGVTHFLEVGPGSVLSGLVARIARRAPRQNVSSLDDFEDAQAFVAESK